MPQALQNMHYISVSRPLVVVMAGALALQVVNIFIDWRQKQGQTVAINGATRQRAINSLTRYDGITLGDATDFVDSLVERFNHRNVPTTVIASDSG